MIILAVGLLTVLVKTSSIKNKSSQQVTAEKSGSSPESGATSKLKTAYDWLVAKGTNYGDSKPSDWTYPSYGAYWDRILYSAVWEPGGTATESDVLSGKTFYSGLNNRAVKTGTRAAPTSPGASLQQYVQYDDYSGSDYTGEESTWIQTSSASGANVWQDTRTGLYWARSEPATLTNSFTAISSAACDFFSTTPRGSYGASSTDPDCGNAINACAVLSLASTEGQSANTDWYLPSQKELQQAYIDGMYNKAGSSFTNTSDFWSSTEYSSYSAYAWRVRLYDGRADSNGSKTNSRAVRCVRRD